MPYYKQADSMMLELAFPKQVAPGLKIIQQSLAQIAYFTFVSGLAIPWLIYALTAT